MEMAGRYLQANGLNRLVVDGPSPWLGIVAAGHTCELVLEALGVLGVDRSTAADLGIRILKLDALNPLDADAVRRLARDVATVLVVEDKQPYLETLVRDALYGTTGAACGARQGRRRRRALGAAGRRRHRRSARRAAPAGARRPGSCRAPAAEPPRAAACR